MTWLRQPFNHKNAQRYELAYARQWLNDNFERLYPDVTDPRCQKRLRDKEFFPTQQEWRRFVKHLEGKRCLEIGSGPAGHLIRWYWAKQRIIIDPLIAQYRKLSLQLFRRTWFTPNMKLYSYPAERLLRLLVGTIDGVIVCRNALDHCQKPLLILNHLARYAKPGCYLLLWTDLYHLMGHNEGHTNITKDKALFEKRLKRLGFTILYSFDQKGRQTINYGCRAVKS